MQVGPKVVLTWFRHYFMLGVYGLLHFVSKPLHKRLQSYRAQRLFDAWDQARTTRISVSRLDSAVPPYRHGMTQVPAEHNFIQDCYHPRPDPERGQTWLHPSE